MSTSREFHDVLTEFSDIEDIAGPELSKKYDLLDPKSFNKELIEKLIKSGFFNNLAYAFITDDINMRGEEEGYKKVWNDEYTVRFNGIDETYNASGIIRDFDFFWEDFEED